MPSETPFPAVAAVALLVATSLAGCTAPPSAQGPGDGDGTAANVTELEDRIVELNDRIAELQDRIADLEAAVPPGTADPDQVRFEQIADEPDRGLDYSRVPWGWDAVERLEGRDRITKNHLVTYPEKPYGAPGVALLDFDGDGDQDIFVPNGPGAPHSLFSNQLRETGTLTFDDVAEQAGVAAPTQDGNGVCYGDTDNDGDPDLLVVSRAGQHRFFVNEGDGTFRNVTAQANLGSGLGSVACSMGDVDGDGLLDIAIANTFPDWRVKSAILFVPFEDNARNQLFRNTGGNAFADVSDASGFTNLTGVPEGKGTITWAIALVDVDVDGDLDVVHADDQAAVAPASEGGVDRGYNRLLLNDGTGNFTDVTVERNLDFDGDWMGLAFADLDRDGHLDFFSTNFGDYAHDPEVSYRRGHDASDWFLGQPDGSYYRPGVGRLVSTPFGWGVSPFDYDLDGDTDLIFHGAILLGGLAVQDNPGSLLRNDGAAGFSYDQAAMPNTTDHNRRGVQGVAVGDLDGDGDPDMVTSAAYRFPKEVDLERFERRYRGPFDPTAHVVPLFETAEGGERWDGPWQPPHVPIEGGDLSVEINRGGHGNAGVQVRTVGAKGLIPDGRVNRDGIGAIVEVQPHGQAAAMRPVVGGSSYASQNSLQMTFGLGQAPNATVTVHWPGGVTNRLHDVQPGEAIVFPEIPCSIDTTSMTRSEYEACVADALDGLVSEGVVDDAHRQRLEASALRAYGS